MTAFFVATIRMKDPQKFQEYGKKAAETFGAYKGELVLRGKAEAALAGSATQEAVGIVKFPTMKALTDWFNSKEYQALIPLRDQAADMTIIAYNAPA